MDSSQRIVVNYCLCNLSKRNQSCDLGETITVTTELIGCAELTVSSHWKNLEEHQLGASVKLQSDWQIL